MSGSQLLDQVADVLEKAASYLEEIETKKTTTERVAREKAASELAGKLSEVTGETMESSVIEKLSKLDPEISSFLGRIAGDNTGVDSMGGPKENEKTASAGRSAAEDRLVDWIVGP